MSSRRVSNFQAEAEQCWSNFIAMLDGVDEVHDLPFMDELGAQELY